MVSAKQMKHIMKLAELKGKQRTTRICQNCKKKFVRISSIKQIFCSVECYKKLRVGKLHSRWKGGKIINDGYIYIYCPDHPNTTKEHYVLEHRLVMEKHLGRYLKHGEIVHHKDHNKQNNKFSNLMLCRSNGKHSKIHHNKRDQFGRFIN